MWSLRAWAVSSHEQALANARTGATDCSRRRVEREDVALFLAAHTSRASDDRHTVATEVEHPA
jgi:hypothetical protein